jgi:hypothetical protein
MPDPKILGLAVLGVVLRAAAAAIVYALLVRFTAGAYPPVGRVIVAGVIIAAIMLGLDLWRARRRREP